MSIQTHALSRRSFLLTSGAFGIAVTFGTCEDVLPADAAGATILHGHFHHFSPNGGVSGVLVLVPRFRRWGAAGKLARR